MFGKVLHDPMPRNRIPINIRSIIYSKPTERYDEDDEDNYRESLLKAMKVPRFFPPEMPSTFGIYLFLKYLKLLLLFNFLFIFMIFFYLIYIFILLKRFFYFFFIY